MSHTTSYHKSENRKIKVLCRICKQGVTGQNYGRHLKEVHPEEDSKDLRVFGQPRFLFGKSKPAQTQVTSPADEEEKVAEEEGRGSRDRSRSPSGSKERSRSPRGSGDRSRSPMSLPSRKSR